MTEEERKSYSEQQQEMAQNSEQILRSLVKAYKSLKTLHGRFVTETEDSCMDFAGPELQTAMQLSLHKRTRFTLAVEDLVHEDFRHGGLDRITPKQPQTEESPTEKEKASMKLQQLTADEATQENAGETEALDPEGEQPEEDLGDGSN
jgi:hypothetical protein